ncbi:hypothetical protein [Streptomyces sp. NPDC094466]|uniref:hypothetical protein n=1 Tax=Streptomyces sp. NPDC094466 TaxID=3366065 RepID=UPI003810BD2E
MKSVNHEAVLAEPAYTAVMLAKTGQIEPAAGRQVFATDGALFGSPLQLFLAAASEVRTESAGIAVGAFPGRPV